MPAPLLLPALSLISGLLTASTFQTEFSVRFLFLLSFFFLAAWTSYFLKKDRLILLWLLAAFFLVGLNLYSLELTTHKNNALRQLRAEGYLDFTGKVLKLPERRPDRDIMLIRVSEVSLAGEQKTLGGNLRLTVAHSTSGGQLPELKAGDQIEFSASLSPEETFRNFFPDFMPRYLRSQKIQARAYCKSPLLIKKLNSSNHSITSVFSGLRRKLQRGIERDFPGQDEFSLSPEGAVLEALLLGTDGRLDEQTDRQFQKTGLYHLLAISGAHVAVVSFLFYSFLSLFITRKRIIYLILLAILIFYALLVEGQPSVFRAVIMASVFLLGKLIFADTNLLNTLALSALVLLLLNHFSLEDVGFQLTFLASLSLILFFEPVRKFLPRLPLKLSEMMALSLTAVAGTMPVIISNFHRVTFASLFLNLPETPLMGLIMATGYVYLGLNSLLPAAGHLLSYPLKYLIQLFNWIATWLEPLASLSYRLPSPPVLVVIGFYLFLLLLLLKSHFRWQKLLTASGLAVFFLIMITYPFPPASQGLAVTFLDVGQGDCTVVELPDRRVMVIDAGGFPRSNFDSGESLVSPFLWHRGYKKIDYLVCSHFHPDHAGGLPALARNFRLKEFWFPEEEDGGELERQIKQAMSRRVKTRALRPGIFLETADYRVEVLYPDLQASTLFSPGNDLSAVLRLEAGQESFLFPADITAPVEEYLVQSRPEKLKATVLKIPHHGSRSSSSQAFLQAVAPDWAVITCGRNNVYGFPDRQVLEKLEATGIEILRIDRDGAIRFERTKAGLTIKIAAGRVD